LLQPANTIIKAKLRINDNLRISPSFDYESEESGYFFVARPLGHSHRSFVSRDCGDGLITLTLNNAGRHQLWSTPTQHGE
jgi:hypothetical protein